MAYKGHYSPKNFEKYVGNPTKIKYRSLWERRMMVYLDENPNVLEWGSEIIIVPYISPLDGRVHRYFVDFFVKMKTRDGKQKELLIEIKPLKQCHPPKESKTGKRTKRFYAEAYTFAVNEEKWKAARDYAKNKGWEFKILTEDDLFVTK